MSKARYHIIFRCSGNTEKCRVDVEMLPLSHPKSLVENSFVDRLQSSGFIDTRYAQGHP